MIYAIIGWACFLGGVSWYLFKNVFFGLGSVLITQNDWLLFSLCSTGILSLLMLGHALANQKNPKLRAQLVLMVSLFSVTNVLQWDLDHSGWGIGEMGSIPFVGLLGASEPLVVDFLYMPPRISDRLTSLAGIDEQSPTLWADYKAGRR